MSLRFTEEELASLLIFRQESMYYLTGYDTTGYSQRVAELPLRFRG